MGDKADKIVSIQALRFVAAAMVVFAHSVGFAMPISHRTALQISGHASEVGTAGVDIFFVLSGFVITMTGPLAVRRPSGAEFFWRRWSRVAPLYYVLSAATVVLLGLAVNFPQTLDALTFWPVTHDLITTPYVEQGWTLSFEMVFYSAMALILVGGRSAFGRNIALAAGIVGVLIIARQFSAAYAVRFLANPIFAEFGFGAGLAYLWPRLKALDPKLGLILVALAIGLFCAYAIVGTGGAYAIGGTTGGVGSFTRVMVFGIPAGALVTGVLICDPWLKGPIVRVMARLGGASYSIYLAHVLVIAGLGSLVAATGVSPSPWVAVPSAMIAGIGGGVLVYLAVESPLINAFRRLKWPPRPTPLAPAQT